MIYFRKMTEVEPDNPFNHYNLACLLSRMGCLEKANQIFSFIVHQLDPFLTECYFLMAVNFGLVDNLKKARYYLNLYLQLSPDGEMVVDAKDLLLALNEEELENEGKKVSCKRKNEVLQSKKNRNEERIAREYQENKAVQDFLRRSLYQKNEEVAEKAIQAYGLLPGGIGKKALKEFVRNPWIKERLRLQALLALKNIGVKGLVTVFGERHLRDIDIQCYPLIAPQWLNEWQDVLDCTLANMRSSKTYSERFYEDAQAIWIDYINNIYPCAPSIKKVETWAAGLEYATAKFHFLSITQKKLAQQYAISASSVSAKYRQINSVLFIEHRAYHNMLIYLAKQDQK